MGRLCEGGEKTEEGTGESAVIERAADGREKCTELTT